MRWLSLLGLVLLLGCTTQAPESKPDPELQELEETGFTASPPTVYEDVMFDVCYRDFKSREDKRLMEYRLRRYQQTLVADRLQRYRDAAYMAHLERQLDPPIPEEILTPLPEGMVPVSIPEKEPTLREMLENYHKKYGKTKIKKPLDTSERLCA